ncbi:unnamed protein product [Mesocestoides corti]|uniref:Uncharacterized protein n=1 Tax=Mesocestoides corti TaxID=53468 RepID=A0A3P6H2I4_MESCO|nr:unnamed protein product [Mesocestoides corti]
MDTLNSLSFPNTPEEELKAYEEIKGWSTSSMCMVPLAVSFIISFAYDSTYQFISAIGLAQYDMNAIEQKMGVWLLLIHPVLIPYAVFYYIPALRFWVKKQWHRTTRGLFGRRREKWMKHSGDI